MIRLVEPSLASADAGHPMGGGDGVAPYEGTVAVRESIGVMSPKASYRYVMIVRDARGRPYDDGSGRGAHYAVCAYSTSMRAGEYRFIMDDTITIWRRASGGPPIDQWPSDPAAEGWTRLD